MWENPVSPAHPRGGPTALSPVSHRGGPGLCVKGGEVLTVLSRWESCSANTVGVWAVTPSSMWERTKLYSSHRMRRRQELWCTCRVWGLRIRCAPKHLCQGPGAGQTEVEQPPKSSMCCCQGGDWVSTDVILIYSQTSNVNQIVLYFVINVNHKTIKAYWAASKDSSVKSRRAKPLKKCQAIEKVNKFWRNVSGLLCFQGTQGSLCA